jgi:hypothetical protein
MKEDYFDKTLGMASASYLHNYIQTILTSVYFNTLDDSKYTVLNVSNVLVESGIEIIPDLIIIDDKKQDYYCVEFDHPRSFQHTKNKYLRTVDMFDEKTHVYAIIFEKEKSKLKFTLYKMDVAGNFEPCKTLPLLKKNGLNSIFLPYQEKLFKM